MKNWQQNLIGFLAIAILSYLTYILFDYFSSLLSKLDAKTAATILGSMLTIAGAIFAVLITQNKIKQREIDEHYRTKKIEIYYEYIKHAVAILQGSNPDSDIEAPSEKDTLNFFIKFHQDILLWGSPGVIKATLEFKKEAQNPEKVLVILNKLYKEFRKDIGLSNYTLTNCDLIKLFLSDPEELDKNNISKHCF